MFSEALTLLNSDPDARGNFAAAYVSSAATPSDYYLATHLPEMQMPDYNVDAGAMSVYPTMAGLSGMDSAYAQIGAISTSKFLEETAKITAELPLSEKVLRQMQDFARRTLASGGNPTVDVANDLIGYASLFARAHWDTAEFLRGQSIFNGAIDWTFNGKNLLVDYGVPAENRPAQRQGTEAYDQAGSTFWADVRKARRQVGRDAVMVTADDTFDGITDNPANAIHLESLEEQIGDARKLKRYRVTKRIGDNQQTSDDVRDVLEVVVYHNEGSIIDPSAPTKVKGKRFVPTGKIAFIGEANRAVFRPGRGAEPDLTNRGTIGYYHIAPTTEGNALGRWAEIYSPENARYMVTGKSAGNELPVIESPDRLYILDTQIDGA